ncbi:alpha/beta hydrolase [Jiulongibacter sediminis]|uniref:alpha/beta hydrolase n=1 Tax=Jiulongibacter sediminis TaxID=1605367 RepID=UPI0026F03AB8|nr:alpha/beta hydrolase [Jiulongibacter sediminis]
MKLVWLVLLTLCSNLALAQNLSGITGQRDHSYNNGNALKGVQKEFPDVKLAISQNSAQINAQYDVAYCKTKGRTLTLDLFEPKGKRNNIIFIFVHGGGWRSGDKSQHHEFAKELAARGYTVLTPEYRLSTEALYPAAVADVKTAIAWAHKRFGGDGQKLAVGGFSAGGQMAAFLGATPNLNFQNYSLCPSEGDFSIDAVVDVDGILAYIHPESAEGDDSKSTSAATYYFGYSKSENPNLWISAGALAQLHKNAPPYLFINSREERMYAGREDFIRILNSFGIYSEVHTFKEAPHSFPQMDRWFLPTVNYIDHFLVKTLSTK